MALLSAGDLVLSRGTHGGLSLQRVLVNQHVGSESIHAMLEVVHQAGRVRLTPDHVLLVGGSFAPAHLVKPGSVLTLANGRSSMVMHVVAMSGTIINPVTVGGTIVATSEGEAILAATHPQWSADFMLSHPAPLPYPSLHLLAIMLPAKTQEYFNVVVEPLFHAIVTRRMQSVAAECPTAFSLLVLVGDAVGLVGFVVFHSGPVLALAACVSMIMRAHKA